MSVANKDHFTCNRCERQKVVAAGTKPSGWGWLEAAYTDRSINPDTGKGLSLKIGHLCDECRDDLVRWWDEGKP